MCLTIPAQIIKIKRNRAVVQEGNRKKEIDVSIIPTPKVGDWILYISKFAVKKISKRDAQEILELLETQPKINISGLDKKFIDIIRRSRERDLTKKEILYLLKSDNKEREALYSEANIIRKEYLKDFICIHGIIEFSNYCENDCLYCGLRAQNKNIVRYRMKIDEIVEAAQSAVKKGYKLLVLQSGEDYFYTDKMLVEIIKKIKEKNKVFIFISVGERSVGCYKKMKKAGASGVLLRFETSNKKLFKKLHPRGKKLKNRFQVLNSLQKMGYFIATGSIIGLPNQTTEDLADDILMIKKYASMVSMGPFVPSKNTPLQKELSGDPIMNLKMISILRLMMPEARIPVVTALETLIGEDGRKKALSAGANSLMFNVTPKKYRVHYKIYNNKFFQKENVWEKYGLFKAEESYKMLEERINKELEKNFDVG